MIKGWATVNGKPTNIKGEFWTYKGILAHADGASIRLNGHTLPLSFFTEFDRGFTWLQLHAPELNFTVHIFVTDRSAMIELFDICTKYIQ